MKKILLGTVFFSIMGGVSCADATCTPVPQALDKGTWTTSDIARSIVGLATSIIKLCGDGEAKAQLIASQEEANSNAGGGGGGGNGGFPSEEEKEEEDLSNPQSNFTGSTFSYVQTNILSKEGNVGYQPLKDALAATNTETVRENLRTAIISNFFADPQQSEQTTTEFKKKQADNRQKYILDATRRHITWSNQIKNKIQADLTAVATAPLTCSSELKSLSIDAETLEQAVKMELVDLALQIEMMEADAIQFLTHQPVELLSEDKPHHVYTENQSSTGDNES